MNWVEIPFQTIGGLGLFLYGMHIMSDGLKMVASNRIRNILSHLTKNRIIALLVGAGVTALIQSSSATTVLTVGFVNAGLLTFKQAISVILGANIGTTFTAWLVSIIGKFSIATYALPCIGIGFYMRTFIKRQRVKEIGEILLGFGLIFFGLSIMKDAFGPIKESQRVVDLFAQFSTNPLLGILVGTIFTMILQSSSATIAIVQLLAFNGVIGLDAAIPLILGDNIGTTITAELASIGTSVNAKRTARAHTLFNVLGVCVILPFVWTGLYGDFIRFIFPGSVTTGNIMAHIAVSHSAFNVINALFFTVFIDMLLKVANALVFEKKEKSRLTPQFLEEHLLENPTIAMEQVIKELIRMAELAKETVQDVEKGFFDNDEKLLNKAEESEQALDEFQKSITQYLIRISEKHMDTRGSKEYPILLHSVNDLEKIGDYSKNIVTYAHIRKKEKLVFSDDGVRHIQEMFKKLYELFENVIASLKNRDNTAAESAIDTEDQIDIMKAKCREDHIARLSSGSFKPEAEMMIMDMATNIEKMGDHLISIAKAVLKDLQWGSRIYDEEDAGEGGSE
jgi:phosphate:Na+ symporter